MSLADPSVPLESPTTEVWASPYPFFTFFDTTALAVLADSWNELESKLYLKNKTNQNTKPNHLVHQEKVSLR